MKKVQEKRQITRTMTESQIRDLGMNLWIKRKNTPLLTLLLIGLAWGIAIPVAIGNNSGSTMVIALSPIVIIGIWGCIRLTKEGNKFWNENKDKEEPIDLG